jgi:copper chaperone CopZ
MRTILLVGGLVVALALNVATVTVGAVASVVSGVVEAVTGVASVKTRLDREVATARGDLDGAQVRVQRLEGEIADRDRRVRALEAEVESLKPRQVTYRGQKKLLGEAVEDTSERVARRTAVGATRNVAATFGEAIPVIGIGVVVAATAWELKDACDTMKDLHELGVALDPSKANSEEVSEVCGLKVPSKEEIWAKVKASPGEAWAKAKEAVPELPEMPKIDWTPWN